MQKSKPSTKLPESTVGTVEDRQRRVNRFFFSKLPRATRVRDQKHFLKDGVNTKFPIRVLKPCIEARNGVLYFIHRDADSVELYSQMQMKINLAYNRLNGIPEAILSTSGIKMGRIAVSFIPSSSLTGEAHFERVQILKDYSKTCEKQTVSCKLIDTGHEMDLNVKTLHPLLEVFAQLPKRIYKFQLDHLGYYKHSILLWTFIHRMSLEQNPYLTVEFINNKPEEFAQGILRDSRKPMEMSINEELLALIFKTNQNGIQIAAENSLIPNLQVTFVTKYAEAFVRNCNSRVLKHLKCVLTQISGEERSKLKPEDLSETQMYLLLDPTTHFQRVRIIPPITSKGARVYYIDFGRESNDIIRAEKLILASGIETQFPSQCVKVKLHEIDEIGDEFFSKIKSLYEGEAFQGRVIQKAISESVPLTMDLIYTKHRSKATLTVQLKYLILTSIKTSSYDDNEQVAAELVANEVRLITSYENIVCPHQHIFSIKWINPKYVEGAELNVLIESIKDYNDITVVELEDNGKRKNTIRNQLREQQERNSVLDFTRSTKTLLKDNDGQSLFMMPLDANSRTLGRVAILGNPQDKPIERSSKPLAITQSGITYVPVYLLDYAKIETTKLENLHLLIPRYLYVHPPMAVKAKLVERQWNNFPIKTLSGRVRKVRILKVKNYILSPSTTALQTVVEMEII